ncbi:MAG: helix-turn-helix transcriptional regulator [Gemmatimonadaceae bacterium]|nr:helix-turn-helix transcriptional regulator [Gemmatimonadaceae bacterium]
MPRRPKRSDDRLRRQQFTGQQIAGVRKTVLHMTQAELRARLGFASNAWLSDIEGGRNSIDAHDLQALADLAGYPVEYFTDPTFEASAMRQPRHRLDWEAVYPDDPQRARIHDEVDQLFRKRSGGE